MRGKIRRGALIALIAVALIGLAVEQLQLRALQAEEARLERLVGSLEVSDPERLHLALVKTPEPLHLLWRVHLPANTTWRLAHESASGSSGWNQFVQSQEKSDLFRWRVVESQGSFTSHMVFSSGSSTTSFDPQAVEFLRSNWDRLDIDVAGKNRTEVGSVEQIIPLLTIRIPDELMPMAKKKFDPSIWSRLEQQPLLKFELGSEAAFTAREEKLRKEQAGA